MVKTTQSKGVTNLSVEDMQTKITECGSASENVTIGEFSENVKINGKKYIFINNERMIEIDEKTQSMKMTVNRDYFWCWRALDRISKIGKIEGY